MISVTEKWQSVEFKCDKYSNSISGVEGHSLNYYENKDELILYGGEFNTQKDTINNHQFQ